MAKKRNFFTENALIISTPSVASTETPEIIVEDLPTVSLQVFCQLSGRKADQIAGFRRYAQSQRLSVLTVPEWRNKLVEFDNRPMR